MEKIIISQNKHWDKEYLGLYERNILSKLISNLETKHIQVLQGIRRSGKSSLFKLLINHLRNKVNPQQILYINLDDPFFTKYSNDPKGFYEVVQIAQKLTGQKVKYLFLDEVQAILGWEKYVKSVYDSGEFEKVFITGSNSSLLNSKYASLLTGRYLSNKVYPLNFKEILKINQIDTFLELNKQIPKVLKIVDDMMRYGSFVEVYESSEEFKREILTSYYDAILLKDALQNSAFRDIRAFKDLAYYSLSNLTSLYSYLSLSKAVKITDKSAKEYISALNECYLFNELKLFSYSLKEQINNKKKLYLSDNGFMDLAFNFSNNYGKLFENLVFTELQKQGFEIYFYNKDIECDFIAKKEDKLMAIQVCYELNEQNKRREFNGLLKLPFEVDEKYIITYNQNENTTNDVKVVRFWEYFG